MILPLCVKAFIETLLSFEDIKSYSIKNESVKN
jgi:hypothetical protein